MIGEFQNWTWIPAPGYKLMGVDLDNFNIILVHTKKIQIEEFENVLHGLNPSATQRPEPSIEVKHNLG
jgi:hypothetical protein